MCFSTAEYPSFSYTPFLSMASMKFNVYNNFVLNAFGNHNQVDVIYTDYAKAFDRVDHGVLVEILYKYGFIDATPIVL